MQATIFVLIFVLCFPIIGCKKKKGKTADPIIGEVEKTADDEGTGTALGGCFAIKSEDGLSLTIVPEINSYKLEQRLESTPQAKSVVYLRPLPNGNTLIFDANRQYLSTTDDGKVRSLPEASISSEWSIQKLDEDKKIELSQKNLALNFNTNSDVTATEERRSFLIESQDIDCVSPLHDEPIINFTAKTTNQNMGVDQPVYGFVDLHNHLVSNVGFDGHVIAGQTFHPYGIHKALDSCKGEHGTDGLRDFSGIVQREQLKHSNTGYPSFSDWPNWDGFSHQIGYYKWLQRAFLGGLRLFNMLATNNKVLCKITSGDLDCDDMKTVDRQLDEFLKLIEYIDWEEGGPGKGWLQVATSPSEAREIIAGGKLAVILGIEVPELFNCTKDSCTKEKIDAGLQKYYDKGVRYIFPLHGYDNGFGGSALFTNFYNVANYVANGAYYDVVDCADLGVTAGGMNHDGNLSTVEKLAAAVFGENLDFPTYPPSQSGHCNSRGLTENGRYLIEQLMDKKVLFDIDHMSLPTFRDVVPLAAARNYPLFSSHSNIMSLRKERNESQLTDEKLGAIRDSGGLVALISHQTETDETLKQSSDCSGSTQNFTRSMNYLENIWRQNERAYADMGIGIGVDANGYAKALAPRFGPKACANIDSASNQSTPVTYPFTNFDGSGEFGPLVTGEKTFDFNTEGLATIGLLPEFIQDLKNIQTPTSTMDALMNSAEKFLKAWEQAEASP